MQFMLCLKMPKGEIVSACVACISDLCWHFYVQVFCCVADWIIACIEELYIYIIIYILVLFGYGRIFMHGKFPCTEDQPEDLLGFPALSIYIEENPRHALPLLIILCVSFLVFLQRVYCKVCFERACVLNKLP